MSHSLYQRLGGAAGVAAVVDDVVDRHAANPVLAHRFHGKDLPQLKALGVSFLCADAGGPSDGAAHGAAPQHAGMGFSAAELPAVVDDWTQALLEQGLGEPVVHEVVLLVHAAHEAALQR